jgi:uncharacterized protein YndB with AHSA1/START domain
MANGHMLSEALKDEELLIRSGAVFPSLHQSGARTLVRDRWERLVSSIEVPYSASEIWDALTKPERLVRWFAACHGSLTTTNGDTVLDFEDGEFFLVHTVHASAPGELTYLARWLGIGQATSVNWRLEATDSGTRITVTEEAKNPPWDWQTWNGGGWPGILEQLSAHLRTGMTWRWPWRRMGPYAQIELPVSIYTAWDLLFGPAGLKYWLSNMQGCFQKGATFPILMGDASGIVDMSVDEVVQPGERPPSFLPYATYRLRRPSWNAEIPGRLWLEPAGWGNCLLQVFNYNWEALPGDLQLSERRILTGYWADAARRAKQFVMMPQIPTAPHNW